MGDLSKRPRGGWQVGSGSRRREGDRPESLDLYAVEWVAPDVALIRHYGDLDHPDHVCCIVKVTIRDSDRAHAYDWERRKGAVHALQRTTPVFERRHAPGGPCHKPT